MALTKEKKNEVVEEVSNLLTDSKMTVLATYQGTSVKAMQTLRKQARSNGTNIRVVKNRLVIKALGGNSKFGGIDTNVLKGQLLYAFNNQDEVAPAQSLANFAKSQPSIAFVGAITAEGVLLGVEDVKALAALPSKDQLRAKLAGTLSAPLSGFVNVMASNVRGVLYVLQARAESIA